MNDSIAEGHIPSATGLYVSIDIDAKLIQTIKNFRHLDAKIKSDVAVRYKGCEKRYSLPEFLQKLGFKED